MAQPDFKCSVLCQTLATKGSVFLRKQQKRNVLKLQACSSPESHCQRQSTQEGSEGAKIWSYGPRVVIGIPKEAQIFFLPAPFVIIATYVCAHVHMCMYMHSE